MEALTLDINEYDAWLSHFSTFPPLAYTPILLARIGMMLESYMTDKDHKVDASSWFMWDVEYDSEERQVERAREERQKMLNFVALGVMSQMKHE